MYYVIKNVIILHNLVTYKCVATKLPTTPQICNIMNPAYVSSHRKLMLLVIIIGDCRNLIYVAIYINIKVQFNY